jgi:hypothetical protein
MFYLYKFTFDQEKDYYYAGISGPQPPDYNMINVKGKKTKTLYTLFEDKTIKEHWDELLNE